MGTKAFAREVGESIPPLKDHGVKHLVAADKGGLGMQLFTVTPTGASYTVVFADEGKEDMADADYRVFYGGEQATTVPHTDVSTKAATGFDIINCTAAELVEVLVIGRLAGMAPDAADA